jgi:transcriptional regulator with XRE-family HTH domain
MNGKSQLGDFLQTRRSQLSPDEAGVPTYGERRRVPGLRREELALAAGVSASYYARLEQGHSLNASPEVLDAIARALRLDESERRHLHDLARSAKPHRRRRPAPERVTHVPAIVIGRRSDVLAWNRLGHALFAGHLDPGAPDIPAQRPNMARLVFLDAHTRDLYADWPSKARAVVGNLRLVAGKYPQDAALHTLLGELSARSEDFKACAVAEYEMQHPLVGSLTVTQQTWSQEPGPSIVAATAAAGTPSRVALDLLAQAVAQTAPARSDSRLGTG